MHHKRGGASVAKLGSPSWFFWPLPVDTPAANTIALCANGSSSSWRLNFQVSCEMKTVSKTSTEWLGEDKFNPLHTIIVSTGYNKDRNISAWVQNASNKINSPDEAFLGAHLRTKGGRRTRGVDLCSFKELQETFVCFCPSTRHIYSHTYLLPPALP